MLSSWIRTGLDLKSDVCVLKILLVVSGSASTSNACLGFGLRFYEVPLENLLTFGILSNISGFTSVLAVALSKTSFALTLLRLTDGWMKWFIIALIVLLNTTHLVSVATFWLSCNPPAKTYNYLLPGECWPTSVTVNYSFFVGGKSANKLSASYRPATNTSRSQLSPHSAILRSPYCPGGSCSDSTCTTRKRSAWPLP